MEDKGRAPEWSSYAAPASVAEPKAGTEASPARPPDAAVTGASAVAPTGVAAGPA